jgi:hypothetical protein
VIAVHCYWTAATVAYDWNHSYSAGREAARFLKQSGIAPEKIYSVGYATAAIQPYFAPNRLARGPAYWDWSVRNSLNDGSNLLSARQREYVMVGYKLPVHRDYWARFLSETGYRKIQHFEGNLFWHTRMFESESFDLYRSTGQGGPAVEASALAMNDQTTGTQLLAGFHHLEGNSWRWTSRNFSVALNPPAGSESAGARLTLHLFLAEEHLKKLGPITIHADAGGEPLPARTFSTAGTYVYSADIPASSLKANPAYFNFHLDKAIPSSAVDSRELGLVVTSVGLEPVPDDVTK